MSYAEEYYWIGVKYDVGSSRYILHGDNQEVISYVTSSVGGSSFMFQLFCSIFCSVQYI